MLRFVRKPMFLRTPRFLRKLRFFRKPRFRGFCITQVSVESQGSWQRRQLLQMYRQLANRDPDNTNLHTHRSFLLKILLQKGYYITRALGKIHHRSFGKDTVSQELQERYCITRALGKILYHKSLRKDIVSQKIFEKYCITRATRKILHHKILYHKR